MGKFASKRRNKRQFSGNRFTKHPRVDNEEGGDVKIPEKDARKKISSVEAETNNEHMASGNSASFEKLQQLINERSNGKTLDNSDKGITGFRLCDMGLIADVFCLFKCPECDCVGLSLEEDDVSRKGCASKLRLCCLNCSWKHLFWTSKRTEKSFEVNKRLVYGMRRIGKGHAGASKFCSIMNMPSPLTAKSFRKSSRTITQHVKKVAKACMKSAAEEVCAKKGTVDSDDTIPVDCGISCDGSWQRRGHSSLNGCVTIISMETGKVLDVEALTSHCKECKYYEKLDKNSKEYREWKAKHTKCNANYRGSAPAMEPEGALRMFERSVEENNLRYTDFYGDGDSKSFSEVKNTYPGIEVQKRECIGHVQKRVGTALRKLKKDNPGLGGKGKLTNAMIDKLQNYYGIALRSNVGDLGKMAKAIHASLFHCASSDANPYHTFHCPPGGDSWCRYQQDKANGTKLYKHGSGLPKNIIKLVKPVYQRLMITVFWKSACTEKSKIRTRP
jgi:hypothetical protein